MKLSQATPETDALIRAMHEDVSVEGPTMENLDVFVKHARKLEQECDAMKKRACESEELLHAEKVKRIAAEMERDEARVCGEIQAKLAMDVSIERDQLRKVADEMAHQLQYLSDVAYWSNATNMRNMQILEFYNNLPHRKDKK